MLLRNYGYARGDNNNKSFAFGNLSIRFLYLRGYLHAYDILMIYVMIVIHVRTLRWLICITRMTNTHGREFANQI